MKKFFIVFLCLIICTVPVFADYEASTSSAFFWDYPTDILDFLTARSAVSSGVIQGDLVDVEKTMLRVSASDTSGFKSVMLSLIGDYETVITDYTYQSGSSGYYSHSISIERDWSWICSACIFALVVFCTFRIIGGLLCR